MSKLLPAAVFAASLLAGGCSDAKPKPSASAAARPRVADNSGPTKTASPPAAGLRDVTLVVLGMT